MAVRFDRVSGIWDPTKKRFAKASEIWDPVKKRYDKVKGIWAQSYQGYDAQVHNLNPSAAGFNSDGSFYVNQASYAHPVIQFNVATITFSSPVPFTMDTIMGIMSSLSVSITGNNSPNRSMAIEIEDSNFTTLYAIGTLSSGGLANPFTGNISLRAQSTGSTQSFGIGVSFDTGSQANLNYSASAPAGCLTIGGIQLKNIEII